jgi:uncharacterized protein (UPF0332 family)
LSEEARQDIVRYRAQRAQETLEDARILARAERWQPCVNRLYYACFYAVSALLYKHDQASSKHSGVRSLFNRHFVMAGKVSKPLAQLYNDLFSRRQESDYLDFVRFEASQVQPLLAAAAQFVEAITALIDEPAPPHR